MKKKRNNRGFTMAELLIVVGIIAVLAGVGFIAVQSYQKSMAQLEADAIAKEIFIAAQNHLTMAESQGYMSDSVDFGTDATADHAKTSETEGETPAASVSQQHIYRFDVPRSSFDSSSVLGLMLPFGSIDETIRAGGNYVIYYQANPARVLDVFYGSRTGRYTANPAGQSSYSDLLNTSKNHSDGTVIGWYGGADTQESGVQLNAPTITVENAERLTVTVDATKVNVDDTKTGTDKSIIGATDLSLKLIITNANETAMAAIPLDVYASSGVSPLSTRHDRVSEVNTTAVAAGTPGSTVGPVSNGKVYSVVLDDITTADMHFADINGDATIDKLKNGVPFKPGEDIIVYAVAYSNTTLCSIVYSNAITVNSLFADYHADDVTKTAYIANFRHLENLDGAVSGLGTGTGTDFITVNTAEQIVDLGKLPESENGASGGETGGSGSGEGTGASDGGTGNGSGEGTGASGGGTDEEAELTDSGAGTTPAAEKDLSWTGFVEAIKATRKTDDTAVKVYTLKTDWATQTNGTAQTNGAAQTNTEDGKYRPVSPSYALTYKGGYDVVEGTKNVHKAHTITNVSANETGAAGLFGAPTGALTVSDLVLYDFEISGSDAGALAGTLPAGSLVTNVLAYHGETAKTVTGTGNAGGLVGSFAAGSDASAVSAVSQSAAAMLVSSTGTGSGGSTSGSTGSSTSGSAGGLIGSAASVTVTDSYSGGHTVTGKYKTNALTDYNVNAASGNAGGLIGAASGSTTVDYCYSTCSASGTAAGSLIGAASGDAIAASYSYAVGKTSGNDALLGTGKLKDQTITDFDFVHGIDMDNEDLLMPEIKIAESDPAWKIRGDAAPYDSTLGEKYVFPTVNQLHQLKPQAQQNQQSQQNQQDQQTEPVHLSTHYGDWEEITLLADADLALINAERLSAKITLPKEQIVDGGVITMLIRGETSHPIDASNDAYDKKKDVLLVLKVTKSTDTSNNTVYALSLSPESNVPGKDESEDLQVWFNKLKKAGVGVKVPDTGNAEIELNLDDITAADKHFAQLFKTFIPGENISVAVKGGVVASDKLNTLVTEVMNATENSVPETKTITTQAEDGTVTTTTVTRTVAARTNSLFADPQRGTNVDGTNVSTATAASASIANFRHLENLDTSISGVNATANAVTLKYTGAKQIVDLSEGWALPDGTTKNLSWSGFIAAIINGRSYENTAVTPSSTVQPDNTTQPDTAQTDNTPPVNVYQIGTGTVVSKDNCFLPVDVTGLTTYDGGYTVTEEEKTVTQSHSITGVLVNTAGNAGLFGTLPSGSNSKVSNLELIDFNITSTGGNAGALAGVSNGADIANVLAHNTTKSDNAGNKGDAMTPTVTAALNAGGLVGNMNGGSVTQSAAALVVSSSGGTDGTDGNAGGLIGNMTGGEVTDSYSGGHTSGGGYDSSYFNVIAKNNEGILVGNAGGLIGAASGTVRVNCCYSTCSASGTVAGSLIGAANGNSITVSKSYAVGKTSGTTSGSVQTFLGSGSLAGRTGADYDFVYAVDMDNDDLLIPAAKGPSDSDWKERADAVPYDSTLGEQYIYPTVNQLYQMAGATFTGTQSAQFTTHYGDWGPIPQLYVNLELINRERLSAKITLPAAQIADGGKITMLIHGDTNTTTDAEAKDALLVFKVTTSKDTGGTTTYALSLSSESTVPGVTDMAAWLGKVKKTEAGIATATVEGVATVEIELNLDDITAAGRHFTNLFPQLTPGENITAAVKGGAIAKTDMEKIVKDATEASWTVTGSDGNSHGIAARTNSLFADPDTNTGDANVDGSDVANNLAAIANFRHLENLDNAISSVNAASAALSITKAVQIEDLSWTNFKTAINEEAPQSVVVYTSGENPTFTTAGCYMPVNPTSALEYDGKTTAIENETTVQTIHSITGVVVNTAGNAGLFGTLPSDSNIHDLELIDFDIKSTGGTTNAGALAGVNNGATVTNVLAHNSTGATTATVTVTAGTGSAGGLIGRMSGANAKVEYCAAALVVNSSGGDAGGLIGKATGGTVSGSYSGGHTTNGKYTAFNVTAASSAGNAGGLIGDASGVTKVENCYSTCSAKGATAGGLVGTASGTFTNCYATGLVQGTTESAKVGAFAGSFSGSTDAKKPCLYFEAVNSGMAAIGDNTTGVTIRELDENLIKYKEFVGTTWTDAKPYDEKLKTDYEDKVNNGKYLYNLKGMTRLDASTPATNFVATHYGDWPMPGILVNNTKYGG